MTNIANDRAALRVIAPSGVTTTQRLLGLGISSATISRRCRPDGIWQRLAPGVILLQNGAPSDPQRLIAAQLYCGPTSALTGIAALYVRGMSTELGTPLDVLIPADVQRASTGLIRVARTRRFPETEFVRGLRVADVARAAWDAGRRTSTDSECVALFAGLVQQRHIRLSDLQAEAQASGRARTLVPNAALRSLAGNAHSVAESAAQRLYRKSGLPPMEFNVDIFDGSGRFLARPDGWRDDVAVAWEIDSFQYHASPEDYRRTLGRRSRMENAGIIVVAHSPDQVKNDPRGVIRDLTLALERGAARPRPPIVMRLNGFPAAS